MLNQIPTRVCPKCKTEKPLTREFFWKWNRPSSGGFRYRCILCDLKREPVPKGMRRCNGCKAVKWLSLEFFYLDLSDPSGFAYRCKQCFKWHRQDPAIKKALNARYLEKYHADAELKQRMKARQAINRGYRTGKVPKPIFCQFCLTSCRPEAHHHLGYEREHWLDVVWLCKRCHTDIELAINSGRHVALTSNPEAALVADDK